MHLLAYTLGLLLGWYLVVSACMEGFSFEDGSLWFRIGFLAMGIVLILVTGEMVKSGFFPLFLIFVLVVSIGFFAQPLFFFPLSVLNGAPASSRDIQTSLGLAIGAVGALYYSLWRLKRAGFRA